MKKKKFTAGVIQKVLSGGSGGRGGYGPKHNIIKGLMCGSRKFCKRGSDFDNVFS